MSHDIWSNDHTKLLALKSKTLEVLGRAQKAFPSMRTLQIICGAFATPEGREFDGFYITEEALVSSLEKFIKKHAVNK